MTDDPTTIAVAVGLSVGAFVVGVFVVARIAVPVAIFDLRCNRIQAPSA